MAQTIAERLRKLRVERGYRSSAEAARAHGWNENTYRAQENGQRGIPAKRLTAYAKAYGVSLAWLATGSPDTRGEHTIALVPILEWADLREFYGMSASEIAAISPKGHIAYNKRVSDMTVACAVTDDSMTPTAPDPHGMFVGDLAVVDLAAKVRPGKLCVIYDEVDRQHCVRRAEFVDRENIRFIALNPAYPPITLRTSSPRILGLVVGIIRNF